MVNELDLEGMDIHGLLSCMHEGVVISDKNGCIRFFNDTQARIDDIEPRAAMGRKITDIYQLDHLNSSALRCLSSGRPIIKEILVYRTRLGKVANVISNAYPLYKSGKLIGVINFSQDFQLLDALMVQGQKSVSKKRTGNGTRFSFDDIIGNDPAVKQAVDIGMLAADTPSPVMICGKTGTGKEMFAQSIHNHSSRNKKFFIPVNCAAIPENLLEGILFGTSHGAFTGAVDKGGLFEQANGGTIFLDELDAMPLMLQAKLLRVIQERKVRRLGSLTETDLDIKIISSVSRTPLEIARDNTLRMDLFYRMGVVLILLPSLAERKDALGELTRHFIHGYNQLLGRAVSGVSAGVAGLFQAYHWPGNVRELKHVIESAMNMAAGHSSIQTHHLPSHIFMPQSSRLPLPGARENQTAFGISSRQGDNPVDLRQLQRNSETELICEALEKTSGNAAGAARYLGLSPQALHYKLKKHQIDHRSFQP